jgi:hypothetical protein
MTLAEANVLFGISIAESRRSDLGQNSAVAGARPAGHLHATSARPKADLDVQTASSSCWRSPPS